MIAHTGGASWLCRLELDPCELRDACSAQGMARKRTRWIAHFSELSATHRRDIWALADWYLAGCQEFGRGWCKDVEGPRWTGIRYSSLRGYACTARRFPPEFSRAR